MATTITFGVLLPTVGGDADLWGGYLNTSLQLLVNNLTTRTTDYDFAGFQAINSRLKRTAEISNAISSVSGVLTLDLSTVNHFRVLLTENITSIVVTNPPASGVLGYFTLKFTNAATNPLWTVAVPASWKFSYSTPWVMTPGTSARDRITGVSDDAFATTDVTINIQNAG